MNPKCKYTECTYDALDGEEFCNFHAPADKKTMTVERFNLAVFSHLKTRGHNLDGYVFPGMISFENTIFEQQPTFRGAVFTKGVKFRNANFKKGGDFLKCEFRGEADYIRTLFAGDVNFNGARFIEAEVRFDSAEFNGEVAGFGTSSFYKGRVLFLNVRFGCKWVDFSLATFTKTFVSFAGSDFAAENTAFANTEFKEGAANWNSAKFQGNKVDFSASEFSKCPVEFVGSEFASLTTTFDGAVFVEKTISFKGSRFTGGEVTFVNTQFNGTLVNFSLAHFYGDLRLRGIVITNELRFIETRFKDGSAFYLSEPVFKRSSEKSPRVLFLRVRFNPFLSFFEGVRCGSDFTGSPPLDKPILLFRYSYLKDVYFANNDMALFSFYNSSFFEEAHFISGHWIEREEKILKVVPVKFTRSNQIVEEQLLEMILGSETGEDDQKKLEGHFQVGLLRTHTNVGDLYLRFKTAADRAKNYHLARWFYFNEFEMKRRGLLEDAKKSKNWIVRLGKLRRFSLYSVYKVLAGYGEMAWWSFIWFVVFTGVFALLHLFNGVRVPTGNATTRIINYEWQNTMPNIWQCLADFFHAVLFTLYRIIPVSYLPHQRMKFDLVDHGFWDLALTLANSVVLVLMIVFIGMGLKRHFRRF